MGQEEDGLQRESTPQSLLFYTPERPNWCGGEVFFHRNPKKIRLPLQTPPGLIDGKMVPAMFYGFSSFLFFLSQTTNPLTKATPSSKQVGTAMTPLHSARFLRALRLLRLLRLLRVAKLQQVRLGGLVRLVLGWLGVR